MKPEDISVEDAIKTILGSKSQHYRRTETLFQTTIFGSNTGFLDGAVHRLDPHLSPDVIRQMMHTQDGHSPNPEMFNQGHVIQKPQGYIALAIYIVLLGLPGWLIYQQAMHNNLKGAS